MTTCSGVAQWMRKSVMIAMATAIVTISLSSEADARRRRHFSGFKPAYSAIVVDAKTGRVLHGENPDAPRFPASVTKVMTLYLLFDQIEAGRLSLNSELEVSAEAASQPPTKLGLRPGSTITVDQAIKALVTKSANDAAVVIAENLADSEERFAEMMTRKARALGMSRTTFRNASGLPDSEQVTTARDLALLGRAIQDRHPRLYRYFSTSSFAFRGRQLANHNKLLGRVHGVDGIKTGYTNASGFNLLTSARRGERHVVAVVMGGRSGGARDARMRQLIEQHFADASTGPRTAALITENTSSETRKAIVAKAQVPPPSRAKADDAEIVTASSASTAPAGSSAKGVASSGAAASAPVMAMVAASQPASAPMMLRPETAKPAVTASVVPSNGNPNPKPGVLGTLSSSQSAPDRTGTIASARPAPATAQPEPATIKPKGEWSVQIGAYPSEGAAKESLAQARVSVGKTMASAQDYIEKVQKGSTQLVRARFAGFDRDGADAACKLLKKKDFSCMPIRN